MSGNRIYLKKGEVKQILLTKPIDPENVKFEIEYSEVDENDWGKAISITLKNILGGYYTGQGINLDEYERKRQFKIAKNENVPFGTYPILELISPFDITIGLNIIKN